MSVWDWILVTSPIWGFVLTLLGLREIIRPKYDDKWIKVARTINRWLFKDW